MDAISDEQAEQDIILIQDVCGRRLRVNNSPPPPFSRTRRAEQLEAFTNLVKAEIEHERKYDLPRCDLKVYRSRKRTRCDRRKLTI